LEPPHTILSLPDTGAVAGTSMSALKRCRAARRATSVPLRTASPGKSRWRAA